MRTTEKFEKAMKQVEWWHNFHKKPVWLVAVEDDYVLSVVKPSASEIAKGTAANLYDVDMAILDTVKNF